MAVCCKWEQNGVVVVLANAEMALSRVQSPVRCRNYTQVDQESETKARVYKLMSDDEAPQQPHYEQAAAEKIVKES